MQECGNLHIRSRNPRLYIGNKDYYRGGINRKLSLRPHTRQYNVAVIGLDTARIHQHKPFTQPLAVAVDTVARNTRGIVHNGKTFAYYFIKKRRFADIRSADNCDNRFCHKARLLLVVYSENSVNKLIAAVINRGYPYPQTLRQLVNRHAVKEHIPLGTEHYRRN